MPSRRNNCGLLARVNFPLYTLQMLTSRHILVGGGGGSSKTGVANGFEIFELSHNGSQFVAEEVTRHETGPSVVMNCTAYTDGKRTWIAAGQESHCQLYNVNTKVVTVENGKVIKGSNDSTKDGVRHRKGSEKTEETLREKIEEIKDDNSNIKSKKLQLKVKPADSVQTDFSEDEPLQRIVRISLNGKFMATGGTDCHVRLWKFPQLHKIHNLEAHTKEIDDIDFSPDSTLVASIAKDGKAFLWNVSSGAKDKELTWSPPDGLKYMYKRCRFRKLEEAKSKTQLFMLSNAVVGKNPSFLQMWDIDSGSIVKTVPYKETLSALAVSDDGKFVAVGTMFSGSVDIYVAFSLRRALHVPGAHSMFVTGLEFLPTKLDGPAITSNTETAVVSISVDNKICIHSIPFRHTLPFWFVIVLIILSVCGAFIFCSYLGI
ncbi:prolactin regulatory element-binding protein isoform X1 [Hylaeus anthracinus]|uniref:prolactin regulatory element-binding protein isoform X2 n=1 Tax=Hylaeus volcanicus TaxID=313075 RepID=UPI0023B7BEA6|nr:prolactin regulatory element-binding protein isoform X2 [Hylaeus volcanicus]XP_053998068.1 prolactin regulatory element-binding protein isoform X1 [Hylaeus anthracinus]